MQTNKAQFAELMAVIVSAEMNEDEQSIFEIEGQEWMDKLLGEGRQSTDKGDVSVTKLQMGISHDSLEIVKTVCSCGALIVSCLTFYLNYMKDKGGRIKADVERLEAIKKLEDIMKDKGMPFELVEVVNKKYARQIIDMLDHF